MEIKEIIARRVAKEIKNGDVVNLGIGLPTMVGEFIPDKVEILLQSENGILGMGNDEDSCDRNIVNAGGNVVGINKGAVFFDSATSFGIIRGGHVNLTVLGALQVDEKGNLASHIIPGKLVPGMGGAMDLVTGAKKVIVATTHCDKNGKAKILKEITLPATALNKVDLIITELAVIEVKKEGLILKEISKNTTLEQVISFTAGKLIIENNVKKF